MGVPHAMNVVRMPQDSEKVVPSKDVLLFSEASLLGMWYMRRRRRPKIPAPTNMPMPDKQADAESKARLFNIYLCPWVLDDAAASIRVCHLLDFDVVPGRRQR